jgi:hypothetical protein
MELISNNLVTSISQEPYVVLVLILLSHYGILEVRGKLTTEASPYLIYLSHAARSLTEVHLGMSTLF